MCNERADTPTSDAPTAATRADYGNLLLSASALPALTVRRRLRRLSDCFRRKIRSQFAKLWRMTPTCVREGLHARATCTLQYATPHSSHWSGEGACTAFLLHSCLHSPCNIYTCFILHLQFCVHSVCCLRTFVSEFRLCFVPIDFPSDCVFLIDFPSDCFCHVLFEVLM